MWIHNRAGSAALLLSATGRLFTPEADQVGWVVESAVFSHAGQQVGWFSDGFLRDLSGSVAGFTADAAAAIRPALPSPSAAPGVLSLPSPSARPSFPPPGVRAADRSAWSPVGLLELLVSNGQ